MAGRPVNFLELGSYEGRSTVWMLESLLTHPQSHITCVDPFVYFEVGHLWQGFHAASSGNLLLTNMRAATSICHV
jgi:hypothetical protein